MEDKLKRFANDQMMSDAVYQVILDVFLKKSLGEDVPTKAARFISIEKLQDAWKEIYKFKSAETKETGTALNVGL